MATRAARLAKLLEVQEQLKALHETRRAGFLDAAAAAEDEACRLAVRFDEADSLSGLFPELYHRRIANALAERDRNIEQARHEAGLVAQATLRTNMVERSYRQTSRAEERRQEDRQRLEIIEGKLARS